MPFGSSEEDDKLGNMEASKSIREAGKPKTEVEKFEFFFLYLKIKMHVVRSHLNSMVKLFKCDPTKLV